MTLDARFKENKENTVTGYIFPPFVCFTHVQIARQFSVTAHKSIPHRDAVAVTSPHHN